MGRVCLQGTKRGDNILEERKVVCTGGGSECSHLVGGEGCLNWSLRLK